MLLYGAALISFSLLAVTCVQAYQSYDDDETDVVEEKKFSDEEKASQDFGFIGDADDHSNVIWLNDPEDFIGYGSNVDLGRNEAFQINHHDFFLDVPEESTHRDVEVETMNSFVQDQNEQLGQNTARSLHTPIEVRGSRWSRYKLPVWPEGLKRSDLRKKHGFRFQHGEARYQNGEQRQVLGTLKIDGNFYLNNEFFRPVGRPWMKGVHHSRFGAPVFTRRSNSNSNMNANQNVNRNYNG